MTRRGDSIGAALACLALLLAPSILAMPTEPFPPPSSPSPAPPPSPSPAHASIPPEYAPLVREWLNGTGPTGPRVTDPAAILESLIPASALPPPPAEAQDWSAFFAAFGERPTPAESRALLAFEMEHPHVAQQVRVLANDVARAQSLRTEAFAATTPADWALLPSAVALLAAGRGDELSAAQAHALGTVDVVKLAQGADIVVRSASAAAETLRAADAQDERLRDSLPPSLLEPGALESPSALLSAAAGAPPVQTRADFAAALEALQLAAGLPLDADAATPIPPDFDAPLANVLSAVARQAQSPTPESGRATLATIAAELSPLLRGAVNLSLSTPGQVDTMDGSSRPLAQLALAPDAQSALGLVFQDQFGASSRAQASDLATGMEAFAAARGLPFAAGDRERVAQLEGALGPEFSARLGAVLAAQAAYERDLAPGAPAPARASDAWQKALPVLESGAPLTTSDITILQDAVDAAQALRGLEGERASGLVDALMGLGQQPTRSSSAPLSLPGGRGGVLFDGFGVLVTDDSDTDWPESASTHALVVDLGGNDTYRMPMAGVSGSSALGLTSIAVDLGGNDVYESKHPYTLGAAQSVATPGLAMLLDVSGDDSYSADAEPAMGWGQNAYGLLVDLAGDDRYHAAGKAMGGANTTVNTASALGVLLDGSGNDDYSTPYGLGALDGNTSASSTVAAMIDLSGGDAYAKPCPQKLATPCFAVPRPSDLASTAQGAVAFFDGGGKNAYPRPTVDPTGTTATPQAESGGGRFSFAADGGRYENQTLAFVYGLQFCSGDGGAGCTGLPVYGPDSADADGNGVPDFVENSRGRSWHPRSDNLLVDTDGDGFPDSVEWALGTDPADAESYPVGVPRPPDPAGGLLPTSGALEPRGAGFLLNLPPVVAIGLPGKTTYNASYLLTIDLGTGDENADAYLNATASNGFSVSLGGPTRYQPTGKAGAVVPALASTSPANGASYHTDGVDLSGSDNAASGTDSLGTADAAGTAVDRPIYGAAGVSALVDLAGADTYAAQARSLASVTRSEGLAILVDAGGDDNYTAPGGASMGYADAGGQAFFFDLAGKDSYKAPTQGVVESSIYAGGTALFVDALGNDGYDSGAKPEIGRAGYDGYQGQVLDVQKNLGSAPPSGIAQRPQLYAGPQAVAGFLDLDGADGYVVRDPSTHTPKNISASKENRMRASPTDDNAYGRVSFFMDTRANADSDKDGSDDAVETAGGTNASSPNDRSYDDSSLDSPDSAYHLHLPRLGIAVGSRKDTNFTADREYALLIDLGGKNNYSTRAGASSPRFGTSLAIGLGDKDAYNFTGGANLSSFPAFALANASSLANNDASLTLNVTDGVYGGAQGAGVFGIGVLVAGGAVSSFRQTTRMDACCNRSAVALGASQGAGVLGVGVLVVQNSSAPPHATTFESDVRTDNAASPHPNATSVARNAAQGAGILGVGILANLRPDDDDSYLLRVEAEGTRRDAVSGGQGYGLEGVGVFEDSGGDNALVASGLAQAAADGAGVFRGSPGFNVNQLALGSTASEHASGTAGVLLLPGVGRDIISSTAASQAYASGAGFAMLYDAEGDDAFTLTATPAMGQAAAYQRGTAILVSDRGNTAYRATTQAQAFATGGSTALLADFSGADSYEATALAQAMLWNESILTNPAGSAMAKLPATSFAFLFDAGGVDAYRLGAGMPGQAGLPATLPPRDPVKIPFLEAVPYVASGLALFLDVGGCDRYYSSPPGSFTTATIASASTLPAYCTKWPVVPGNDARWNLTRQVLVTPSGTPPPQPAAVELLSWGVDAGTASEAYDTLFASPGLASTVTFAPPAPPATLHGEVNLTVGIAADASWVDRVEFLVDGVFLARGALNGTGHSFYHVWNTSFLPDPAGPPAVPDGAHTVEAWVFPRAGTGPADASGAHAAVDPLPVVRAVQVAVDNRPYPRFPDVAPEISMQDARIDVPMLVDRDLHPSDINPNDKCGEACVLARFHLDVSPSEWSPIGTPDPGFATGFEACGSCSVRNPKAFRAGNVAYLWWELPTTASQVEGYRVFRNTAQHGSTQVGFVDSRSTAFLTTNESRRALHFVDPLPADDITTGYNLSTVLKTSLGHVMVNASVGLNASAPWAPPATGLNATGTEGGVYLKWRAAPGVLGYNVQRKVLDEYARNPCWVHVANVTAPAGATTVQYADASAAKDVAYSYRVQSYAFQADSATILAGSRCAVYESPIPVDAATAMATPGENVTLLLTRKSDPGVARAWPPGAGSPVFPAPGSQTTTIRVDTTGLPDGDYWLNATLRDANASNDAATTSTLVLLDGHPPTTTLLLPAAVGGEGALNGGLNVSFETSDGEGSGVATTYVYAKLDDEDWPDTPIEVAPGAGSAVFTHVVDGAIVSVVAFSQDEVGNLEGVSRARSWTPTFRDAFEDMLRDGRVATAVIDLTAPHSPPQETQRFARPGQKVEFSLALRETGSGVSGVSLVVGKDSIPMLSGDGVNYTGRWTAREAGTYQAIAVATDVAGNVGIVELGTVTVDPYAPLVDAVSLTFGDGRAVGRPGDIARIRVAASDSLTPEGRLAISVATSTVSTRAATNLTYDRDERAYVGSFVLDQVRNASVVLTVEDLAGNSATRVVGVPVDATMPALANVTIAARPDGFVASWSTDVPTQGRVLYGKTPAVGDSTAWDASAKNHSRVVSGLQPDSDYYVKVDALTPSGTAARSELILLRTLPALSLRVSPVAGFPTSSGASVVDVQVKDWMGGAVPDALVRATIRTPRGAEQVIATVDLSETGGRVRLPVESYQDGGYALDFVATSGDLRGNLTVGRFVIDRTPPTILLPPPRAIVPGSLLVANVTEAGSGVDLANASWTFAMGNDRSWRCPVVLANETLSCRVPAIQGSGRVLVHVAVPDAAGNVGTLDAQAPLARGPLALSNASARTSDGFGHLRSSAEAVLSVDADAPAAGVWADLSPLGGSARAALAEKAPGKFALRFQPSAAVADGARAIRIEAESLTGELALANVTVLVDNAPPRADGVSAAASSAWPTRADITVTTSEPTQATLSLDAGAPPPHDAALSRRHVVRVEGLRPSAQVNGSARLVDEAGNVAVVPVSFVTAKDAAPPGSVGALRADDAGDGRVRLSWAAAADDAGVERYLVERALVNGSVTTLPPTAATWLQDVAPTGVPVTYHVRALDLGGNEGPAAAITVTSTAVPHLSDGLVDPPLGGPGLYTYRVRLADAGPQAPDIFVVVDGLKHAMRLAKDGTYETTVPLGPTTFDGAHRYSFRAESSRGVVLFPDADLQGPVVVAGAPAPHGGISGAVFRAPAADLVGVLAATTVLLLLRRRRSP